MAVPSVWTLRLADRTKEPEALEPPSLAATATGVQHVTPITSSVVVETVEDSEVAVTADEVAMEEIVEEEEDTSEPVEEDTATVTAAVTVAVTVADSEVDSEAVVTDLEATEGVPVAVDGEVDVTVAVTVAEEADTATRPHLVNAQG